MTVISVRNTILSEQVTLRTEPSYTCTCTSVGADRGLLGDPQECSAEERYNNNNSLSVQERHTTSVRRDTHCLSSPPPPLPPTPQPTPPYPSSRPLPWPSPTPPPLPYYDYPHNLGSNQAETRRLGCYFGPWIWWVISMIGRVARRCDWWVQEAPGVLC